MYHSLETQVKSLLESIQPVAASEGRHSSVVNVSLTNIYIIDQNNKKLNIFTL